MLPYDLLSGLIDSEQERVSGGKAKVLAALVVGLECKAREK